MSHPASPSSSRVTFVVRFWREASAGGLRWRGQIEHAQSGEQMAFLELDAMLDFLRRSGVMMGDRSAPAKTDDLG
jgi:hypothetical protein